MGFKQDEIRIGFVSSFDPSTGMASIYYPDRGEKGTVTRMMKVFAPLGCSQVLLKDDQVLVLHLSNGSEAGIVIGKLMSGGASIAAQGGDITFAGSPGSITLSDLIRIKNIVG